MTAVARIAIEDHPMLVADLLLSGPPLPGVTPSLPTADDLSSIFPSGSSKVPADFGLVGFIRDPDGRIAQFGRSYISLYTNLYGNVALLGTGYDHFKNFLHQFQKCSERTRGE